MRSVKKCKGLGLVLAIKTEFIYHDLQFIYIDESDITFMRSNIDRPKATANILIVDDDIALCEGLTELLQAKGFSITLAHDGEKGLALATDGTVDLVILDVMMPKKNGIRVLEEIRMATEVPVIMLTTRGKEVDRLVGLEYGADDYISKPFSGRELALRIRAILKRVHPIETLEKRELKIGPISLYKDTRTAELDDKILILTPTEFDLLEVLMSSAGTVLSREYLTRYALKRELSPYDRSLDTHINNLRRKVSYKNTNPIRSKRATGYYILKDWRQVS